MASRLELHEELCELLGSRNVYFEPPESLKMKYPCIVYSKNDIFSVPANNTKNYLAFDGYDLIYIHKNPDDQFSKQLLSHFDYCRLGRPPYVVDSLYHDALNLYY